ncbi:glycoside hydrolase family 16 protein, partial [Rhodotorula graminis WP1]
KVDNTTVLDAGAARKSVRIHSTEAVKIGSVIIADIVKMPWGCSTWPAFWSNGPNWPDGGEIDVLEGVHDDVANQITLHTKDSGCKMTDDVDVTGTLVPANNDCNAKVNGNTGCSYAETAKNSYGEGFNEAGGGVFVTSFTTNGIEQWFWSRPDVPQNIVDGSPDRKTWGKPSASWPSSGCAIEEYFSDQDLIFGESSCPLSLVRISRAQSPDDEHVS